MISKNLLDVTITSNYAPHTIEDSLSQTLFDLDTQLSSLSAHPDQLDCIIAAASGVLCGLLDILWVGEFSLERGRTISSEKTEEFVKKTAKHFGCKSDDLKSCVKFLEENFPIPADGNTPDFGGGLQHHLRDFAHHPTLVGLIFSLLTQFTEKSYGTDTSGHFLIVNVPERSKPFIGKDIPTKIFFGTIIWFFHLVSDIAGSSSTAGISGGTGLPGPILSLAKELSVLPVFRDLRINDSSLSQMLSKLFNGTLFAKHDENGKIIKETVMQFDFRSEMGIGIELGRQAVPVIANECIVRCFYFIRRLFSEIKTQQIVSADDLKRISWNTIKPTSNLTLARMLTISTGVFTMLDIGEAVISQKYWLSINYVGVGRFALALGEDVSYCLKARNVKRIKEMYETIRDNTYTAMDDAIYERIGRDMDRFGLTSEQTEILYNLEYYKTNNDIDKTKALVNNEAIKSLKQNWLSEWQQYITAGFSGFMQDETAVMHWYSLDELTLMILKNDPQKTWFRLILLEAMLFEPYYPLALEKDKKGNEVPSTKYKDLQNLLNGYKKADGDKYLETEYADRFCTQGYIARLRKCHTQVMNELTEVLKTIITTVSITGAVTVLTVLTAGMFAPAIAVALVGSNFAGLSGAALTSACLAYVGGGAIAAGGLGMAGGTMAIVGGGAILGLGIGTGVGGTVGAIGLAGKRHTIIQSAKLMVSVREIFLNDEHDIEYSNSVYEKYVQNVIDIEKKLVEMRLKADTASADEKKKLKQEVKQAEESVGTMKIAVKSMNRFISSFAAA